MSEARSRERMFTGSPCVQENLCAYAERPIAFFARYVRLHPRRPRRHLVVGRARRLVLRRHAIRREIPGRHAVAAGAQRDGRLAGVRHSRRPHRRGQSLVAIGGLGRQLDVRGRDRRRAPRPVPPSHRACARATSPPVPQARSRAASRRHPMRFFTIENMLAWNVLPPCIATICAIAFVATVSWAMAASLMLVAGLVVLVMFRRAAAGQTPAPRVRQSRRGSGRRDHRCRRQHDDREGVRRPAARASALRRQGRAGDDGPPARASSTSSGCASCTRSSPWR